MVAGVFLYEMAAPGIVTKRAPGITCASTGAIAPVIGSPSLKAARNGLFHVDRRCHASRLGADAGSCCEPCGPRAHGPHFGVRVTRRRRLAEVD